MEILTNKKKLNFKKTGTSERSTNNLEFKFVETETSESKTPSPQKPNLYEQGRANGVTN